METSLGGSAASFPSTRWSVVAGAADEDSPDYEEAITQLCRAYWKPVYVYMRATRAMGNEEAKDLTQEFFLQLMERGSLRRYAAEKGSFRKYLKGAVHLFLRDQRRRDRALKRGGGAKIFSVDEAVLDGLRADAGTSPEDAFERQWAISVLDHATDDLRAELCGGGKRTHFEVFERHDLNPSRATYAALAQEFGLKESEVGDYLTLCRGRLRKLVLARIRDYVDSERDVAEELGHIYSLLT